MGIFGGNRGELKIPPLAVKDANAYECLRIWMTSQGQPTFSIEQLRETNDPRAWGSILADLALIAARQHDPGSQVPPSLEDIQRFFNHLADGWITQSKG